MDKVSAISRAERSCGFTGAVSGTPKPRPSVSPFIAPGRGWRNTADTAEAGRRGRGTEPSELKQEENSSVSAGPDLAPKLSQLLLGKGSKHV